ncbi:MAG: histidinol-phosphate transaminase, partial [bacterium]|nr:histidinol-phosphate transaminase [bacterium]
MLRPEISSLVRYIPGKPISEVQKEYSLSQVHKLASNENPLGPSPLAVHAVRENLNELNLYPDASALALRQRLAEHWQVNSDQIVVGDGSDELLRLIASLFISPESEAVMADVTFGVYAHAVKLMGGKAVKVPLKEYKHDLEGMLSACNANTKMVFVCNPNNPTGTYLDKTEIDDFVAVLPKHIVVVFDEAYYEFVRSHNPSDGLNLLRAGRKVAVMRTFSKAYGLAGLRIGYVITTVEFAAALNTVRAPFNVNALAQVAGRAALDDNLHLSATLDNNRKGLNRLTGALKDLGCTVVPTQANFLLTDVKSDSRLLYPRLLSHGVVVRPGYEFGMSNYLRISIGLPEQIEACIRALSI